MMGKRNHPHRSKHVTLTLEQLVPQDHLVCKIDVVIDTLEIALENRNSQRGHPSFGSR